MKIQLLSDLHLEFDKKKKFVPQYANEDVLILAGDIQVGLEADVWFSDLLEKRDVLYTMGNHEYYGEDFGKLNEYLPEFEKRVNELAEKKGYTHKLYCMQNKTLELGGVRFIGATMWTDFKRNNPLIMNMALRGMTDYHIIRNGGRKLIPQDIYDDNQTTLNYLSTELFKPVKMKTVVFTHHLPSYGSVDQQYRTLADADFNYLYFSDLDSLAELADFWLHGHTHCSFDYMIGKCRVVCNPRGYNAPGHLNTNFKLTIIDV